MTPPSACECFVHIQVVDTSTATDVRGIDAIQFRSSLLMDKIKVPISTEDYLTRACSSPGVHNLRPEENALPTPNAGTTNQNMSSRRPPGSPTLSSFDVV